MINPCRGRIASAPNKKIFIIGANAIRPRHKNRPGYFDGCRSKQFDYALCSASATATALPGSPLKLIHTSQESHSIQLAFMHYFFAGIIFRIELETAIHHNLGNCIIMNKVIPLLHADARDG
jgi:hypothetical protein